MSGAPADRWGARQIVVIGMGVLAAGLTIASFARSLAELCVAYGLGVGVGVGCSYVPAIGAVQHWFSRRRGFASGLAAIGSCVGTFVLPPLASWTIQVLD